MMVVKATEFSPSSPEVGVAGGNHCTRATTSPPRGDLTGKFSNGSGGYKDATVCALLEGFEAWSENYSPSPQESLAVLEGLNFALQAKHDCDGAARVLSLPHLIRTRHPKEPIFVPKLPSVVRLEVLPL